MALTVTVKISRFFHLRSHRRQKVHIWRLDHQKHIHPHFWGKPRACSLRRPFCGRNNTQHLHSCRDLQPASSVCITHGAPEDLQLLTIPYHPLPALTVCSSPSLTHGHTFPFFIHILAVYTVYQIDWQSFHWHPQQHPRISCPLNFCHFSFRKSPVNASWTHIGCTVRQLTSYSPSRNVRRSPWLI